jgi:hypothetical protein
MRELERNLEVGINNLRMTLLNRRLQGERRQALAQELEVLRLSRLGINVSGQYAVLARNGVHPRPPTMRHGPWADCPPLRIR